MEGRMASGDIGGWSVETGGSGASPGVAAGTRAEGEATGPPLVIQSDN